MSIGYIANGDAAQRRNGLQKISDGEGVHGPGVPHAGYAPGLF